jgi:hypothetical protein
MDADFERVAESASETDFRLVLCSRCFEVEVFAEVDMVDCFNSDPARDLLG